MTNYLIYKSDKKIRVLKNLNFVSDQSQILFSILCALSQNKVSNF